MKDNKKPERRDMGDLKTDIVDTANTSKEIVKGKFNIVKTGTKNAVNNVDTRVQNAKKKRKTQQSR